MQEQHQMISTSFLPGRFVLPAWKGDELIESATANMTAGRRRGQSLHHVLVYFIWQVLAKNPSRCPTSLLEEY